jgi:hypothetical protein
MMAKAWNQTRASEALGIEYGVWHPAIQLLLTKDGVSKEKQGASSYSWDKPLFDSPLERRRLKLLNSLFVAIGKFNGRPLPEKNFPQFLQPASHPFLGSFEGDASPTYSSSTDGEGRESPNIVHS